MEILTLNGKGLALALAMGVLFVAFGGQIWWVFIFGMVLFLLLSAIVTRAGWGYKRRRRLGQGTPRGVLNVLANGTAPLVFAGLYRLATIIGADKYALLCFFGFVASVAAITADKFASEIGVLNGTPFSLVGWKRVRKGTSGGVSWVGLAASAIAAAIVAVALIAISMPYWVAIGPLLAICVLVLCGFLGSLVDSILGYFEEKGHGNKFTSNLACSFAGAALAVLIIAIL